MARAAQTRRPAWRDAIYAAALLLLPACGDQVGIPILDAASASLGGSGGASKDASVADAGSNKEVVPDTPYCDSVADAKWTSQMANNEMQLYQLIVAARDSRQGCAG